MQADFSIELGRDDHALEVPWSSPDGTQRYLNLKLYPELLLNVTEANSNYELAEFLVALNSPASAMETAKCDTWLSNEIHPEEEIFGASWKFGSYVDVVFTSPMLQQTLYSNECMVRDLSSLLSKAPDFAASAEFVLRRCYFRSSTDSIQVDADCAGFAEGFCITIYVIGFGDEEGDARKNWVIGLKVVQNALMQLLARRYPRQGG